MEMRNGMFAVVCVICLLLCDPQLAHARTLQRCPAGTGFVVHTDGAIDPYCGSLDDGRIHLAYELNGGNNSSENPEALARTGLPFTLEIPVREGYNFAGWYTDSGYTQKVTQIDTRYAENMLLFAKWTRQIDNHYNVEMYSYGTPLGLEREGYRALRECSYTFLDNVEIPGMPSTRERDYRNNLITSEGQCLQGLCFTPEYILMTSYAEERENLGSLMVFDRESGAYLVTLGMKENSHLGGIAFDGANIWICHSSSSTLERISYEYLCEIADSASGSLVDVTAWTDEYRIENTPSCVTCYGGRLWVATHTKRFDSCMYSYRYDAERDRLEAGQSYNIPSKVQGIAFDSDGTVYLSTSYGRNSSSYLMAYASLSRLSAQPNDPFVSVEMPPCAEEIAIADGQIFVVFESASRKYFEGTDGNGRSTSPLDKILELEAASIR